MYMVELNVYQSDFKKNNFFRKCLIGVPSFIYISGVM